MKTPVTSRTLKQHITYNWWKYLLIALLSFGLVDLLYAVTAYRPPREKTLGIYIYGYMNEPAFADYLDGVREKEMPDMESVTALLIVNDSTYGPVQMMTYMAAGEGDIYLLPREQFLNYAANGALVPLEEDTELIAMFDAAGISLQSGWRRDTESGETHLFGIPQDKLPGLIQYAYAQDGFLCQIVSGGNTENASHLFRILCRDMITAPPAPEPSAE